MTTPDCPTHDELSTYARGLLPTEKAEQVTGHVAECTICEDTVLEIAASSSERLVGRLQTPAGEQPFVDESECLNVVELLRRLGPTTEETKLLDASLIAAEAREAARVTSAEFVSFVTAVGLVTADEAAAITESLPSDATAAADGARTLAGVLVRNGKLTEFQATAILHGRGNSLVYGEYLVLDRCGSGGMGQVYQARHRRMDRVVALKVLSPTAMKNIDAVKRFEREVRAAAKLIHPNIVHAYDAGTEGNVLYLVMEYVAGPDLASLLKRQGKLGVRQACDYVAQAARGLAFAHEKGIVHRDIKPGNLLVEAPSETGGNVKVLDLGLARFHQPGLGVVVPAGELTNSGAMMGTVDYMAPEQALNTSRADAKSDVYSLGCTLYRLVTGENVYAGETIMEKALAHREQPIPSLRRARSEAPAALEKLVARMLAKQPEARPEMWEVAGALMTISAAPADETLGDDVRAAHPRRRTRALVGAVAVIVIGISTWLFVRDRGGPVPVDVLDPQQVSTADPPRPPLEGPSGSGNGGRGGGANSIIVGGLDNVAKENLYIYADPFDQNVPVIDVDSVRYDGSTPLTIEAWIVGDPAPTTPRIVAGDPDRNSLASFFELGGSEAPFTRVGWGSPSLMGTDRHFYTTQKVRPHESQPPGVIGIAAMPIGLGKIRALHHAAVTFRTLASGQQYIGRYWDGYPTRFSRGFFETVYDRRDHLRSFGHIDELRVSKSERYKDHFIPERRFTTDDDTIALYHCDEGSGDVLVDSSGHGLHGRLKNAKWGSTSRYPVADPVNPVKPIPHDPSRFVGGSSPNEPAAFEIIPLPREIPLKKVNYIVFRARNASDRPVPLSAQSYTPTQRGVAIFKTAIEFLDGPPEKKPQGLFKSSKPGVFVAAMGLSLHSERFELASGEFEALALDVPTSSLPVGRYRFHCRVIPAAGALGHDQEATFDFKIVEGAGTNVPGDQVEWKWKDLEPFPAQILEPLPGMPAQMLASMARNGGVNNPDFKQNLMIYGAEPYDPLVPTIEVESLRYNGSTPLTIEAWVVPDPTPSLAAFCYTQPDERLYPSFFELSRPGAEAQTRFSWHLMTPGNPYRVFTASHTYRLPGRPAAAPPLVYRGSSGPDHSPRLQHFAMTFGERKNGVQEVVRWSQGEAVRFQRGYFDVAYDPLAFLRSHGYIDELRISSTVRYVAKFLPERTFVPDADTIALYHCDEGSGNVLVDASGHGRHGKVTNARWKASSNYSYAPFRGTPTDVLIAAPGALGGSAAAEPVAYEIEPLPNEVTLGSKGRVFVRARGASDVPVEVHQMPTEPTKRVVAEIKLVWECLEPGPQVFDAVPQFQTTKPGASFAGFHSIVTDRYRLERDETEEANVSLPTERLPIGRYLLRCRITPYEGAGRPQEATFEFRVVEKAEDHVPGRKLDWKIDGLEPFPEQKPQGAAKP